ncbi:hypothetical protein Hanom_Chr06g00498441 [Helianthus anomalus]
MGLQYTRRICTCSCSSPNPSLRSAFIYNGCATVAMPHAPPQVFKSGPVSVSLKIYQTEGVSALFS